MSVGLYVHLNMSIYKKCTKEKNPPCIVKHCIEGSVILTKAITTYIIYK